MNPKTSETISNVQTICDLKQSTASRKSFGTQLSQKLFLLSSVLICSCNLQPQSGSTVLVVDHFKLPQITDNGENGEPDTSHLIDVDQDSSPDISHGELVSKVVKTRGIRVVNLDGGLSSIKKISNHAKVVNVSLSIDLSFQELSQQISLKVTPDNVKSLRAEVLNRLEALPNNEPDSPHNIYNTVKNIRHLEELARQGVTPVIAAGNMGRETLNILTLAEGCVVVGGLNEHGGKHPDSGNNSLVTEWRPYSIQPKFIDGGMTLYGKQVDLKWSRTSSKGKYLDLQVAPEEILERASSVCEQATLRKLAKLCQTLGLESGIYLPSHIILDSTITEDDSSGMVITSNVLTDDRCLIAFHNAKTPKIWILTGERKAKISAHAIKLLDPEIIVEMHNHASKAVLSERELAPILLQAGLQAGDYDLFAMKESLENNSNNHFIRIKLSRNALSIKNHHYRLGNIRGEKPEKIEGTSFATPIVSAEIAKRLSVKE